MSAAGLLVAYCGLILLASLAGGWVPLLVRLTHKRLELLVSFVSGVMLGVSLLHLLPHALLVRATEPAVSHAIIDPVLGWLLAGLLTMFFIERFFRFHHHDVAEHDGESGDPLARQRHQLTWTGAAIGLSVHSLVAGVALAAAVEAEAAGPLSAGSLAGLGVFLGIFLHKPFDSMTLGTLMAAGRRSCGKR